MAKKKEPKKQHYKLYVDFLVDEKHIARKTKLDEVCSLSVAKTHYDKWKFVKEQWQGEDITRITLTANDKLVYEKIYMEYNNMFINVE